MAIDQKGQSLLEVIVAASVGILVVGALTFATIFSLRNASFAKTSAQATKLAQEGIERVRTGRDRNAPISGVFQIDGNDIVSWDDPNLWSSQIRPNCTPNCYFNIDSSGKLQYLTAASAIPSIAETVGQFKRVIILSDDPSSYSTQKQVTSIVTWTDFAGPHESKLMTILRKL
ncbi:MAG: hypothetical protein ABIC96_00735 [Patescibacteria group bacterium]